MSNDSPLVFSGERWVCSYRLAGDPSTAPARAAAIAIEQTIEYPADLVHDPAIREQVFGRVEALEPHPRGGMAARISYAIEIAGVELTQLLNVAFGNISLQPEIRLEQLELPHSLLRAWRGPRFGSAGLRRLLGVQHRPLLCSALKPMGLDNIALAKLADQLARGGLDMIKDDHGLADQSFTRFAERVARCAAAVATANEAVNGHCCYAPNITAPADQLHARAHAARQAGAGALMVAPGLIGFDAMRALAADDSLALPLLAHPAWLGAQVADPNHGVAHGILFGTIARLAGADVSIFPNYGGRFAFSPADCASIRDAAAAPLGNLAPLLPAPAGGMRLDRADELVDFYGREVMLLIGGDLHRGPDLISRCRELHQRIAADELPQGRGDLAEHEG